MRRIVITLLALCAISMVTFAQDAPPAAAKKGPRNLKILKPEEIKGTMAMFVAGTGLQCDGCHAQDRASDEKEHKVAARKMLEMVRNINATTFAGKDTVTCYTCHRGEAHPKNSAAPAL